MTRKPKSTKQENKLAKDLQAPRSSMAVEPPTAVPYDLFRRKMNETRYADEPEIEWRKSADLVGAAFYIHKAFKYRSQEFGAKIGFECSDTPEGEHFLISFSENEERAAMLQTVKELKKAHGRRAYIGPLTLQAIPSSKPGYKPYIAFAEYDTPEVVEARLDYERRKKEATKPVKSTKKGDVPF